MAVVFDGWHHRDHSPVAIKVMKPASISGEPLSASFAHEVRSAAQLNHPNITAIFDHGTITPEEAHSDPSLIGTPWLAMEKIGGGSIRSLAGNTNWNTIQRVLLDVLDALGHAHARGLIHRDIKPGNILQDEASGTIKLTDFGLAKSIRQMRASARKAKFVSGTPGYMSPEQIEGDRQAQGPWSDIYSVGALGWALATGQPPYEGKVTEILEAHLRGDPKRFRPVCEVPPELEQWLRHAMQQKPTDRFTHAADAAWALRELPAVATSRPRKPTQTDAEIFEKDTLLLRTPDKTQRLESPHTVKPGSTLPLHLRSHHGLRPPFPESWHTAWEPRKHLHGAGLGLWGLRGVALVGRHPERDQLWSCLRECAQSHHPVLALVDGPNGVGKSTLMHWLSERAYEKGQAQTIALPPNNGSDGQSRIRAVLTDHFRLDGLTRAQAVDTVQSALQHLNEDDRSTAAALVQLARPDEVEPEGSGLQIHFGSTTERLTLLSWYLGKLAASRPVILLIEDIHEDPFAMAMVTHLLESERGEILCVASVQSLDLNTTPNGEQIDFLRDHPHSQTIPLHQLRGEDRIALLRELLGLDPSLADQVEKQTGGNPQFAVQLVGHWIAKDRLVAAENGFALKEGMPSKAPDSMFEMWAKRFESLCEDVIEHEVHAVELAAVLGNTIHEDTWRLALDLADLPFPDRLLDRMARLHLIALRPKQNTFEFAHAMFRAAILMRVEQHGRRARWASHAADALLGDLHAIGRRARLLAKAGRVQEALTPLAQAVEVEIEKGTKGGARELFRIRERLVASLDLDPRSRLVFDGEILRWNLMSTRAERMEYISTQFVHLHDWAVELEDRQSQSRILRSYAFSHFDRGEMDEGMQLLERALSIAEESQAPSWTLCLYAKAAMQSRRGEFEPAKQTTREMLRVAESRAETVRAAQAYSHLAEIALQTHAYEEASQLLAEVRHRYEAIGSRKGLAIAALSEGEIHRAQGNFEAAILCYKEAKERGENCENSVALDAQINLGITFVASERFAEARREFNAILSKKGKDLLVYTRTAIRLGLINCQIAERDWSTAMSELSELDTIVKNTKMVDRDFASLATLAGQSAQRADQTTIARRAWKLALLQWERLGQGDRADEAASALESLVK